MISLSCSECGKQLKVKEELAGKKVLCPKCRQAITGPAPVLDDGAVPPCPAHDSSDDATLPPAVEGPARNHGETIETIKSEIGYEISSEIARGGMGAIMRAVDRDIQREVAVKFLLNHADSRQKARFVEEAQITGQLEHPNIVPIHQLGIHEDGRCFFSMKMVRGRSLAEILKKDEPAATASGGDYTLGRLLNILVSICNALAYAHSRQVIHRDLKPANIMVGDFGEVYVMDWGLAKVLNKAAPPAPSTPSTHIQRRKSSADSTPAGKPSDSGSGERVTTHRRVDENLTQAGAVMGTPAYMPPEQAEGKLEEVDERSDIYSLGAILYEMMTLTPPVGRGGDALSVLMRVLEGNIDPPEKRAPERAREGWIPPELSAIALKALAKNREDRYQTVTDLQRDLELFLEGRSVSAKQDSTWEMFKKLVKRNKGASAGAAAALLVLLGSLVFILMSWQETRREQEARRKQGKDSAPLFLADAQQSVRQKKLDYAVAQLGVALDFDPELTDAWLLKGQVLIAQKKFAEAQKSLARYLQHQPDDANARKLVEMCAGANLEDAAVMAQFSEALSRQKAFVLAEVMLDLGGNLKTGRQRLAKLYQERLAAAWPGAATALATDGTKIWVNLSPFKDLVIDLTPLEGMKLNRLDVSDCQVVDLTPLKGMPLTSFTFANCVRVTDLTPLQGMKLTYLNLGGSSGKVRQLRDLAPLRGMKLTTLILLGCVQLSDLSPLEGMPLERLTLLECPQISELAPLRGMPLAKLDLSNCKNLTDLSPLRGMHLTSLELGNCTQVRDLSPLAGMKLTSLNLGLPFGSNLTRQLSDLSPLRGMQLPSLNLSGCVKLTDLTPLSGMPLTALNLTNCRMVSDLSPLQGMPLKVLNLQKCEQVRDLTPLQGMKLTGPLDLWDLKLVRDLSPLKGMELTALTLNGCGMVHDLTPLQGMPLTTLYLKGCSNVSDLSPLKGMKLTGLYLDDTKVADLSPLAGMKLTTLSLIRAPVRDLGPVKGMPLISLQVNSSQVADLTPIRGMPLKSLDINFTQVTDLTPLEGMKLETIYIPPMVAKGMEVLRRMSSLKTIASKPAAQFWKEHDAKKASK